MSVSTTLVKGYVYSGFAAKGKLNPLTKQYDTRGYYTQWDNNGTPENPTVPIATAVNNLYPANYGLEPSDLNSTNGQLNNSTGLIMFIYNSDGSNQKDASGNNFALQYIPDYEGTGSGPGSTIINNDAFSLVTFDIYNQVINYSFIIDGNSYSGIIIRVSYNSGQVQCNQLQLMNSAGLLSFPINTVTLTDAGFTFTFEQNGTSESPFATTTNTVNAFTPASSADYLSSTNGTFGYVTFSINSA